MGIPFQLGGFMTVQDYIKQYSNTPRWELLHIKKALSVLGGFLNSEEDNLRLEAVKTLLKIKKG